MGSSEHLLVPRCLRRGWGRRGRGVDLSPEGGNCRPYLAARHPSSPHSTLKPWQVFCCWVCNLTCLMLYMVTYIKYTHILKPGRKPSASWGARAHPPWASYLSWESTTTTPTRKSHSPTQAPFSQLCRSLPLGCWADAPAPPDLQNTHALLPDCFVNPGTCTLPSHSRTARFPKYIIF